MKSDDAVIIGIVGPCSSGKSTLKRKLEHLGFRARHIAQEHSFVPTMWKKITNPDVLIFLGVSYENTLVRRKTNWSKEDYETQLYRLRDAIQNASIHINTDSLSPDDVLERVLDFLKNSKLA